MVYRREIDGQAVAFGHQGAVWRGAMTMFDHLTGSVWSQPHGAPFMGALADSGIEMEIIPSTMTTWGDWKAEFPETLAYSHEDRYIDKYESDDGVFERSAVVVEYFGDSASYPVTDLRNSPIVNDIVGEVEIAVVFGVAGDDLWSVVSRRLPAGGAPSREGSQGSGSFR